MATKVFIDGAAGTTGLEIRERLTPRPELTLVALSDDDRKKSAARADAMNSADVVILCLPDDAAKEAVSLIKSNTVRVLDASTLHRISPDWTYGFPELEPHRREAIAASARVSNPGCYPTGFLALVRPLTRAGIIPADFPLTVNAVSGYSGGGKAMIEEFEKEDSPNFVETVVRSYGLNLTHKHVPEMQIHAKLSRPPVFSPIVGRFYRGMIVDVPLQLWALPGAPSIASLHAVLADAYHGKPLIEVVSLKQAAALKTIDAEELTNTNRLKLFVFGNENARQARLVSVLDNLGKGAAGAAVQNLNLMMGWPETAGLL